MQLELLKAINKPKTQGERILDLLERRGLMGATSAELNQICFRYSARILDLRKQGYDVQSIQMKKGLWLYILHQHKPVYEDYASE